MLIDFFQKLRIAKVPVTIKELLDLMAALEKRLIFANVDEFYYLSRLCLVKDEKHFDKFDRAYGAYFEGIEELDDLFSKAIPDEWLRAEFEKTITEEEKAKIEAMGGLEELMKAFKDRLEKQILVFIINNTDKFYYLGNVIFYCV